jgi:hypothetical protein
MTQVAHAYKTPRGDMTPQEWQDFRQLDSQRDAELQREAEELAANIDAEIHKKAEELTANINTASNTYSEDRSINRKDFLKALIDPCKYLKQMFSYKGHQGVITNTDEDIFEYFFNCLQNDHQGFVIHPTDITLALKLARHGYTFKPEDWANQMKYCRIAVVDNYPQRRKVAERLADIMSASMVTQEQQNK